jgi:hypothetical protein
MGDDNHHLFVRNSIQFGLECCNLSVWPAPGRFCPFNLDRFQMSTQN